MWLCCKMEITKKVYWKRSRKLEYCSSMEKKIIEIQRNCTLKLLVGRASSSLMRELTTSSHMTPGSLKNLFKTLVILFSIDWIIRITTDRLIYSSVFLGLGLLLLNETVYPDFNASQTLPLFSDYLLQFTYFFLYETDLPYVEVRCFLGRPLHEESRPILDSVNLMILDEESGTFFLLLRNPWI